MQYCSAFGTGYLISITTFKRMNSLVHDNLCTKSLFYHLLIHAPQIPLAIVVPVWVRRGKYLQRSSGPKGRAHLCTQATWAEHPARLPSQDHSYQLQHRSLQRQPLASAHPSLQKHIFTIMHGTANYSFPKYSSVNLPWPLTSEMNLSNSLKRKQQEVNQRTV